MSKNYTMSKSEFVLIVVLILLGILLLAGNYFVLPAWQELNESRERLEMQTQQLESLRREHQNVESYQERAEELDRQIEALNVSIPDYYSQEEIVAAISQASRDSGLEVINITFGGRTALSKDAFVSQLKGAQSGETSGGAGGLDQVTAERLTVNVSGSFDQYMNFLSIFELASRRVYFRSATLNADQNGKLTGILNLLVFSVGPEAEMYPGYNYDAPPADGRADPFEPMAGGIPGGTGLTQQGAPDFYIIISSSLDNNSGVQMGRYPVSATQVSSGRNETMPASITFTGTDLISYRYTLDGKTYSGTYDTNKDTITISVLSRARKSDDDFVGVTLDVINETNKTVVVSVRNDDPSSPRFSLGTTSGMVLLG